MARYGAAPEQIAHLVCEKLGSNLRNRKCRLCRHRAMAAMVSSSSEQAESESTPINANQALSTSMPRNKSTKDPCKRASEYLDRRMSVVSPGGHWPVVDAIDAI
jgi:hypothetical protein